ncbi:MAG: hypothetical protein HKN01_01195 [Acidimicrobiia bacterium]|nr:putative glycolipid-binding domain-containing protein [Acidimicrobiia bacterium]NNF68359.1 hypothetical protein [Acidimicrobiia bacterium]NNK91596.1 hypothetical protein [Acidimicrobiia bacterium]
MSAIAWTSADGSTMERAAWTEVATGHRLAGTTLTVVEDEPFELRWTVITDEAGATTTVGVTVQGPGTDRSLALSADGAGAWSAGDQPVLGLFGATDIELGWTPASLTVPIRRLALDIGDAADLTVVHVDFPDHDITRQTRRYSRVDETRYLVESDSRSDELEMVGANWYLDPRWVLLGGSR